MYLCFVALDTLYRGFGFGGLEYVLFGVCLVCIFVGGLLIVVDGCVLAAWILALHFGFVGIYFFCLLFVFGFDFWFGVSLLFGFSGFDLLGFYFLLLGFCDFDFAVASVFGGFRIAVFAVWVREICTLAFNVGWCNTEILGFFLILGNCGILWLIALIPFWTWVFHLGCLMLLGGCVLVGFVDFTCFVVIVVILGFAGFRVLDFGFTGFRRF